jgi:hypothetical protein
MVWTSQAYGPANRQDLDLCSLSCIGVARSFALPDQAECDLATTLGGRNRFNKVLKDLCIEQLFGDTAATAD